MRNFRAMLISCLTGVAILALSASAHAFTISDTADPMFLISGAPINSKATIPLRIFFVDNTAGTNVQLCAGTTAQFSAGTCGTVLSDSGGPCCTFVTVIDARELDGLNFYVKRVVGTAPAQFTLTIE
jgi:hypothetical protein